MGVTTIPSFSSECPLPNTVLHLVQYTNGLFSPFSMISKVVHPHLHASFLTEPLISTTSILMAGIRTPLRHKPLPSRRCDHVSSRILLLGSFTAYHAPAQCMNGAFLISQPFRIPTSTPAMTAYSIHGNFTRRIGSRKP